MDRLKSSFIAFSMLTLLLLGISAMTSVTTQGQGGAKPVDNVLVTNSALEAIPVASQGTTTVVGTVQSQQAGAWSVGISGTPTVALAPGSTVGIDTSNNALQVSNSDTGPLLVRDIGQPVIQRIQHTGGVNLDPCCTNQAVDIYQVPEGKLLVIEYASGLFNVPAGVNAIARIFTQMDGPFLSHVVGTHQGGGLSAFSQQTRIYAAPGTTVKLQLITSSAGGSSVVFATISGYLEDVPNP